MRDVDRSRPLGRRPRPLLHPPPHRPLLRGLPGGGAVPVGGHGPQADSRHRNGIWGGTTPARRARIAASLPHVDYRHVYLAVVGTWQPPAAGVTRTGEAA